MKRARGLSHEDKLLWWHVTRQVVPRSHDADRVEEAHVAAIAQALPAAEQPSPKANRSPPQPNGALDPKLRRKVYRGTQDIEARLDLHGLRQEEAHRALMQFLRQSQAMGRRMVIVITGKGQPYKPVKHHEEHYHWNPAGEERGVLKRLVPHWLKMQDVRPYVVGFENAGRSHGGEGALYVHIRRTRE